MIPPRESQRVAACLQRCDDAVLRINVSNALLRVRRVEFAPEWVRRVLRDLGYYAT